MNTFADIYGYDKIKEHLQNAIKLNKVSILYAYKKGNFSQGMADAITEDTPAWDNQNTEVDEYLLYDAGETLSDGASLSQTPL